MREIGDGADLGILPVSTGTPPPPIVCKISKTKDLHFDYVLDL
jgi:hypothetical protein